MLVAFKIESAGLLATSIVHAETECTLVRGIENDRCREGSCRCYHCGEFLESIPHLDIVLSCRGHYQDLRFNGRKKLKERN